MKWTEICVLDRCCMALDLRDSWISSYVGKTYDAEHSSSAYIPGRLTDETERERTERRGRSSGQRDECAKVLPAVYADTGKSPRAWEKQKASFDWCRLETSAAWEKDERGTGRKREQTNTLRRTFRTDKTYTRASTRRQDGSAPSMQKKKEKSLLLIFKEL